MRQKSDLRGYQQRTVTYLYENDAAQAVLGMGAGKTASALTAIAELIEDGEIRCALVLAPKKVAQLVWPEEPKEWAHLQGLRVSHVAGNPAQRLAALRREADVYVMGIDNVQWLLETLTSLRDDKFFDLLVVDESSKLKDPTSKRLKALRKVGQNWKMKWLLTGTPRPNGFEDMWGPLTLATNNKLWGKSFYKWRQERFAPADFHGYTWRIQPHWIEPTMDDVNSVSITVPPDEMPELPELVSVPPHWIDLPPAVRATYRKMEQTLVAKWEENSTILAANSAVATSKLSQLVQGFMYEEDGNAAVQYVHDEKLEYLKDMVEGLNGLPVLVAYDFVEDLRRLQKVWPKMPFLGGGVNDRDAAAAVAAWNKGDLPIMALHPASAGHGLNLQFGGSQLIWYGLTWSAELYDQLIKRFHRPGQTSRCFVHHIMGRDTIDAAKYDRVHNKMSAQAAFNKYLRRV